MALSFSFSGALLDQVLEDAFCRLTAYAVEQGVWDAAGRRVGLGEVDVYSWPQNWSDGSCGFGGLAWQAFTKAQTVVCHCNLTGAVVVYHNWRFAYLLKRPSDKFWECFNKRHLPGQVELTRYHSKWDADGEM